MMTRRSVLIYGLLAAAWLLVIGWQAAEHLSVSKSAREALINRAKDISYTLGIVLRSQRHFPGVISKERLESTLTELVKPGEINAIAVLNAAGEVVASAGALVDLQPRAVVRTEPLWEARTVTLMNLVDLGTNLVREMAGTNPPIVLSREELFRPFDTNRPPRPPPPPPESRDPDLGATNASGGSNQPPPQNWGRRRGPSDGRPRFGRPPWMSEEEYKSVIQKQGVHSFLIVMSTQPVRILCRQDRWVRAIIGILATVSVLGSGLAWRNLAKSSELQIRLVRASELTAHLKEMNLAAAGLAHETRNPLNIIRGLAQMISRQDDATAEVRKKSREIIDEADRVTAQLNEFINYSRPREVRRAPVALGTAANEVVRALSSDIQDKRVRLQVADTPLVIEADEQLLRQALFNLVLNAVQAVAENGEILIVAEKRLPSEAVLEVRDNGPGVPAERRTEIFKPYYTTTEHGSGLGLAVVQQIVQAHGWEITCLPNEPRGAVFRLSHLKIADART